MALYDLRGDEIRGQKKEWSIENKRLKTKKLKESGNYENVYINNDKT